MTAAAAAKLEHPLFEQRDVKKKLLVLVTSDRGFTGSYSSNIIRTASNFLRESPKDSVQLGIIGKKAHTYFKRRPYPIEFSINDYNAKIDLTRIRKLTSDVIDLFTAREVDEVQLLYTRFVSTVSYRITLERFLPVEKPQSEENFPADYIFEPDAENIFSNLIPRYCVTKILQMLLEAFASEHGSQMIAMGNATRNAGEMIDSLTLQRNKARQASITKELLDIVGGVEALK